jgi:hypothetical protein
MMPAAISGESARSIRHIGAHEVVASFSEDRQSGATCRAIRLTWSTTIASRPSTTPLAIVRTAPTVPAGIVPKATSMSRSVRRRSSRPRISSGSDLVELDAEAPAMSVIGPATPSKPIPSVMTSAARKPGRVRRLPSTTAGPSSSTRPG